MDCAPAAHAEHERFLGAAFEDHRSMLRGRLLAFTRDEPLAEDLVQDAYARLLGEVCADRRPDNPGGWLYRTATNLAASNARHQAVERRYAPVMVRAETVESPERAAEDAEQARRLGSAIARLPEDDRTLILLAAHGATSTELADRLGRSEPAVRTALCRARGRLRVLLASA